ncbi:ABC transporter permease [Salinibacillus xinjiangensis]|nr:FtsX-like permease family protein [Salinibacillus xinjiangensis]
MFRFIWNSWWRNKERFLLLLVGAIIISVGLSYLVGITQASNGTIVDELQKRWKSSYHIVVRPSDSRSVTEDKNLLEPNYLSGLSGGISLDQYQQIKAMNDVEVAAPIAMMGYLQNSVSLNKVNYTEPGVYRLNINESTNSGANTIENENEIYFSVGWQPPGTNQDYGITQFNGNLDYGTNVLLAGIDPKSEAALVGIDKAMIESDYLSNQDEVETTNSDEVSATEIPVIVSNQEFVDGKISYTIEKLSISSFAENPSEAMEKVKDQGGREYLNQQSGELVDVFSYTTKEAHQNIVEQISAGSGTIRDFYWMPFKPSAVSYREVTSPYPDRWAYSYEVDPYVIPEDSPLAVDYSYRPVTMFGETSQEWPRLELDFKGIFDPTKLEISKDPLTELPMETYFPSKADWVLDSENQPVNPPKEMKPLNNPYGFLTKPPLMLTTIEAAAQVLGEKPISSIRLKVEGVEKLNEESEQILQRVADRIESETGLITDITLGSSPQPALTHIPGIGDQETLGWIEQPWIKLGSSVTIFEESKVGMSGVVASVIVVAMVYVFSSNIMMMYARKKEFAVLLSFGWRPNQLTKLLFLEALLIGLFVSMISWLTLGLVYAFHDIETSILRIFLIGVFGVAIYVIGAFIPGLLVRNISPYETMKTGEMTAAKKFFKTNSVTAMSLNHMLAKWKRSLLSIVAIALPASLLIFFLFITFRLRGIMYTTWLGEYVAMEVGTMHYIAMGVAIAIAVLTTAEIIWQNVSERQQELAVLKALGWQNKTVRRLVLMEGALSGLLGGMIGVCLSFIIISGMYGQIPNDQLLFFISTIIIPVVMGMIGAILPAEKAVNIQPYQGMQGLFTNDEKKEKQFKLSLGGLAGLLFAGCVTMLTFAIPEVNNSLQENVAESDKTVATQGEVRQQVDAPAADPEEDQAESNTGGGNPSGKDVITEDQTSTFQLGQYVWEDENGRNLYFGKPIDTPDSVDTESIGDDMTIITIPITFENNYINGKSVNPVAFKLVSPTGEESAPYHTETIENDGYQSGIVRGGGKVTFANTYVFPKNEDGWHIKFKDWDFGDTFDWYYILEFDS